MRTRAVSPQAGRDPRGGTPHPRTGVEAAVLAPVLGGDVGADAGGAERRVPAQFPVKLRHLLRARRHLRNPPGWLRRRWGKNRGAAGHRGQLAAHQGTWRELEGALGAVPGVPGT